MYFDVDTAIAEAPVNLMPLLDDTDFKTIEAAVAYNAAGMALNWHFVTSAGAYTVTAVTPTTAGNYDWTDQGTAGVYTIEIPASGGASINNDTEGYGWFTGVATGVLPWRGPVIGFRAAALNDALCDGGDNLDVNAVQWLGTACATPTVAGVPEVDLTHVAGATTNVSALATNVDAILTDTAVIGATGGGLTSLATQASVNTIDDFLDTEIAAIKAVTDAIGATGTGLSAIPWNAAWDVEVQSECNDALVANNLDHLILTAVDTNFATTVHLDSVIGHLADAGVTATYDRTSMSLEYASALQGSISSDVVSVFTQTSEIGIAGAGLTNINLPNQTMDIVGNITGNLSGSVGSVTGAVGSVTGAVGSVTGLTAANLDATISSRATPAQVNAEVVDTLNTDTYAEPAQGTPGATITLAQKIGFLYKAWRNKSTQTASQYSLLNDDAATVDHKATFADDGTTATKGEVSTGP